MFKILSSAQSTNVREYELTFAHIFDDGTSTYSISVQSDQPISKDIIKIAKHYEDTIEFILGIVYKGKKI